MITIKDMNNQYAQMFKQRQAYMNQRANQYIQNHQPQHRGQIQVSQGQTLQQHAAMMRQQEQQILAQKQRQRQQFGGGLSYNMPSPNRNVGGGGKNGQQMLNQRTQEMNAKANAELKRRENIKKNRDNLDKDKLRLFVSNRCQHSIKILNFIQKSGISADFQVINIHNIPRNQIPPWLKTVPTLANMTQNEVYNDKNLINWMKNYVSTLNSVNSININGNEVLGNLASELGNSGCGTSYSLIEDVLDPNKQVNSSNNMPCNFEFLNGQQETIARFDNNKELTGLDEVSGLTSGSQQQSGPPGLQSMTVQKPKQQNSYANDYERYQQMRNNDTKMLQQYQQQRYQQTQHYY